MKKIGLIFLFSIVAGCATPTPYQEANYLGYGYHSSMLDKDNARVSFKGNKITDRSDVELMLFYRSAELSQEQGFQFFKFTKIETDRQSESDSRSAQVPYYQYRKGRSPRLRNTGDWGGPPYGAVTFNKFEAVSFVHMAKNKKDDSYYNATEILKNLKPKLRFK